MTWGEWQEMDYGYGIPGLSRDFNGLGVAPQGMTAARANALEAVAEALRDAMAALPSANRWERAGVEMLEQRLKWLGPDIFDPHFRVRAWLRWKAALAALEGEKE